MSPRLTRSASSSLASVFSKKKDFCLRVAEVQEIDSAGKIVHTSSGQISYDYLAVCAGAVTNFRGNANVEAEAVPMKTVEDAIYLRNRIIEMCERSLCVPMDELEPYCNIVIVGGGATGVEIAGVLCEMRKYAISRNSEYDPEHFARIHLISPGILKSMSDHSSAKTVEALTAMGVNIITGRKVVDYKDKQVILDDGSVIKIELLIWVSGIKAAWFKGLPGECIGAGGRIICDEYMRIKGMDCAFCAGDMALTAGDKYPKGHPQVAQVAMQ